MHPKMPWLWVVPICLLDIGSTLLTTPICPPSRVTLLLPFIEKWQSTCKNTNVIGKAKVFSLAKSRKFYTNYLEWIHTLTISSSQENLNLETQWTSLKNLSLPTMFQEARSKFRALLLLNIMYVHLTILISKSKRVNILAMIA